MINHDQYLEPIATNDEWDESMHFRANIDLYRLRKEKEKHDLKEV